MELWWKLFVILLTSSEQVCSHSRLRCQNSARVEVSRCLHRVSFCIQNLPWRRIFRFHPNQLNLNQFLEAGPWASECPYPHPGDAKVQSGWRPLCKRWVKARISRMLVDMISQIHCFFSLSLDFSQFYFRTPPVLKINCLFKFSLQAHSFLHIVSLKCFSLLACFYFHVFVSMNEMWGNWVRNVLSTLTWRRNSIHCRSSSF